MRLSPNSRTATAFVAGAAPTPPDFTAVTQALYRKKLADLVKLVEARALAGLRAIAINPTSSSPTALARYRDRSIEAISAKHYDQIGDAGRLSCEARVYAA